MLRRTLLCAVLGLLRAQPFPCPPACKCVFRDAAQCSGGDVARIAALGLPTNLTHILLFGMGRGVLQNHSFSGMTVLQRLMLSDSHISAVAPGAFNDLVKLKTLRLSRNKITHLPGALLDKTVLLEQLFLDHNALRGIDQSMFQKLVNLQELALNQNQLDFLPASLFTNLGNLKLLDLSGNNLTHLPGGLLGAQAKLERLLLHSNRLVSLDSGLLNGLGALTELQLHRNHIRSITPGAFDRLPNLSSLTLSRNHLAFLPSALFLHAHNLTLLTLFENPLAELPGVLFGEMGGLQELWLNRTQLRTLPAAAFRNLSRLRSLGVTLSPRLSALPQGAFQGLGELRVLSLHSNGLTALPDGLLTFSASLGPPDHSARLALRLWQQGDQSHLGSSETGCEGQEATDAPASIAPQTSLNEEGPAGEVGLIPGNQATQLPAGVLLINTGQHLGLSINQVFPLSGIERLSLFRRRDFLRGGQLQCASLGSFLLAIASVAFWISSLIGCEEQTHRRRWPSLVGDGCARVPAHERA
ncbi:PREDICTED: platelet glycoprotein V [Colobus angolensis palliatus]|uniref:platelet glycoprotein V n=1 Tax=Colobus angolensis palliatus TaxID=336983 RepID=UPI0005F42C92|nr:PREDICTED: platelet glycoprotein V [Colobus angolensis palliatus]